MKGWAVKPQTCSNLISSFWKKQDKRNKIRNRKGAFLKCGLKKKLVESSPVKQFTLCSCLLFEQLNHPWPHVEVGLRRAWKLLFFFPLLLNLSRVASLSQNWPNTLQSFLQSPRNIHSSLLIVFPSCLSFWIIIHGSHSLHGLEASDTSVQNTVGTVSNSLFSTEGQTEASHGRAGDCFFLTFAFIDKRAAGPHLWVCTLEEVERLFLAAELKVPPKKIYKKLVMRRENVRWEVDDGGFEPSVFDVFLLTRNRYCLCIQGYWAEVVWRGAGCIFVKITKKRQHFVEGWLAGSPTEKDEA